MLRKAIGFGTFAAASLALTAFIYVQIAHVDVGAQRYSLVATFGDATNLQVGDPVRLAGVRVGQVTSVKVVRGDAEVRFNVDDTVELSDDSAVAVRWLNLIGQRELYLYPGAARGRLADGDRVEETRDVVDLGELVNQLGPLTASLEPDEINSLVDALVGALDGNRAGLNSIIGELTDVADTLASRDDTIRQLLDDYATLTDAIAKRDAQLGTMVDNLASLSGAFAQSDEVLAEALVELPQLTAGLQTLLSANADEVDRIIGNLAVVTDTVHDQLDELDSVFRNLPAGLQAVFGSASHGQFLLVNNICLAPNAPPCPHPVLLAAQSQGAGRLDDRTAFESTLLGTAEEAAR